MNKMSLTFLLVIALLAVLTSCKKEDKNKVELASISTLEVTEITTTTANSGGNITNDGGGNITSKGIVWSVSQNPSIEQHSGLTDEGPGAGIFHSITTGLTQNNTYYVRAYATNSAGSVYGNELEFQTEIGGYAPIADFEVNPTSGLAPLTVNFTDLSTNSPMSWQWDFGDDNRSTLQNPSHSYQSAGDYNVQLVVSNSFGSGNKTKNNYIHVSGDGDPCHGMPIFTDPRNGQTYNTVQIGSQCWMKENLKYLPSVMAPGTGSGTEPLYYVFRYNGTDVDAAKENENYQNYGVLYNWPASLIACPTGWHLPSDDEWTLLLDYVASLGFPNSNEANGAGNALKSCRQYYSPLGGECNTTIHPRWDTYGSPHGFDKFGFSALPGGYRFLLDFLSRGYRGFWWTSTENTSTTAWSRYTGSNFGQVEQAYLRKDLGFSVRCLRD
jgi:uncharacterized protein (TIGR02145 family)